MWGEGTRLVYFLILKLSFLVSLAAYPPGLFQSEAFFCTPGGYAAILAMLLFDQLFWKRQ